MRPPAEARKHLGSLPRKKSKKPQVVAAGNTENALWRLLKKAYGQPYDGNRYIHSCLIARQMFCREASPRSLMMGFQETYKGLLEHSTHWHEYDWCKLMFDLFRQEAIANRSLNQDIPKEGILRPRKRTHFLFPTERWFPETKGTRSKVRARLLALHAAKQCGISPLYLMLENDLVDIPVQ